MPLNDKFKFNFETKPTTVKLDSIHVTIDTALMISDFAGAYVKELRRRNPIRFDAVELSEKDLDSYFKGLIAMRVDSVNDSLTCWREAKQLLIPAWIEFVMSSIGTVLDTDRGLKIIPTCDEKYDIKEMQSISDKLRTFKSDGITLLQDAFPRTREGDVDTMSMAIIDNYVRAMSKDAHPIASYVAAFVGLKLKEQQAFEMLYRVRYDDVDYIKHMLLSNEEVLG